MRTGGAGRVGIALLRLFDYVPSPRCSFISPSSCSVPSYPPNVASSPLSSPTLSQLEPPERRVHERSPRKTDVVPDLLDSTISSLSLSFQSRRTRFTRSDTHIRTVLPHQLRDRTFVPVLRHTQDRPGPAHQERRQRRETMGEPGLLIPSRPVIATLPAEDQLFLEGDGDPYGKPVAHQRQEVREDVTQMVAAGERAHRVDDHPDGVPDEAGDAREGPAQDLEVDAAAVGGRHGVGD